MYLWLPDTYYFGKFSAIVYLDIAFPSFFQNETPLNTYYVFLLYLHIF